MKFKKHVAGEDGWSDWVSAHPTEPYKMACCDCGLVHEVEFVASEVAARTRNGWMKFKDLSVPFRVLFRVRRDEKYTAALRARNAA